MHPLISTEQREETLWVLRFLHQQQSTLCCLDVNSINQSTSCRLDQLSIDLWAKLWEKQYLLFKNNAHTCMFYCYHCFYFIFKKFYQWDIHLLQCTSMEQICCWIIFVLRCPNISLIYGSIISSILFFAVQWRWPVMDFHCCWWVLGIVCSVSDGEWIAI